MSYHQKVWKYSAAVRTLCVSKKKNRKEVLTTSTGKQATTGSQTSRIVWDNLEEWVRRTEAKDGCGQVVQEGGQCHGGNLEDAFAGGAELSEARCSREDDGGFPGHRLSR